MKDVVTLIDTAIISIAFPVIAARNISSGADIGFNDNSVFKNGLLVMFVG